MGNSSKTEERVFSTIDKDDPKPSKNIMKKNRKDQTMGPGNMARPSGKTTNTSPGPKRNAIRHKVISPGKFITDMTSK